MMLLAADSQLRDEFLSLVQLAPEPVPPVGRAFREHLARVAGVQLADRRHALPLCGPELFYGRPLRLGSLAARSRSPPDEFHFPAPLPAAGVVIQRAHSERGGLSGRRTRTETGPRKRAWVNEAYWPSSPGSAVPLGRRFRFPP